MSRLSHLSIASHRDRELIADVASEVLRSAGKQHAIKKQARAAQRREKGERFIYVMGALGGDAVKIGVSVDPRERKKALQTACARTIWVHYKAVCPPHLELEVEAKCHARLKRHRAKGEWFTVTPEDAVAVVRDVLEAFGATSPKPLKCRDAKGNLTSRRERLAAEKAASTAQA